MDALEARGELFAALSDPTHGYWIEYPDCKGSIKELNLFHVRQMTPLLFAAWEHMTKTDFASVLKFVSVISFRYSVIGGLNTNALEPVYHEAAKSVLNGTSTTPRDVFEKLRSVYVDDQKFEQDFSTLMIDTSGQHKRLAKYILCRLETDVSGKMCDSDTDPSTIEHVLPENPAEEWSAAFPREKWDANVYRLGNLALLEASTNRIIGNSDYLIKREAYLGSTYQTTRRIAENAVENWTQELLNNRQQLLAQRAVHIWRSDYIQEK